MSSASHTGRPGGLISCRHADHTQDGVTPESSELQALQAHYRDRIHADSHLYHSSESTATTELCVHRMRDELETLRSDWVRRMQAQEHALKNLRPMRLTMAVTLVALLLGGLGFGYVEYRRSKLEPGERLAAQEEARQKLVEYARWRAFANKATETAAGTAVESAINFDVAHFVSSLIVIYAGMTVEQKVSAAIDACFERLLFTPEPSKNVQTARIAFERLLSPERAELQPAERFSAEAIKREIVKADPGGQSDPAKEQAITSILIPLNPKLGS